MYHVYLRPQRYMLENPHQHRAMHLVYLVYLLFLLLDRTEQSGITGLRNLYREKLWRRYMVH